MLSRLIAYARGIARRGRIGSEVDEELAFHLQQEIDANIARGLSPAEARRAALRDFGGVTQTSEAVRDVRTMSLDAAWRDVRYGVRSLAATPAFTVVALTVLTLSIGASTAIFSVVDAVILRGLPFHEANRLVSVGELNVKSGSDWGLDLVAPQNFLDWREQQNAFTGLAAVGYASISLKAEPGQEPETLETQAVTADFLNMLLLSLFGVLGIVIACVGIYGVMAYVVTQRTHEIGIRMALGAVPGAILRSVLGRAAIYLAGGLAIGLVGAWVLGGLVSGFLFQIPPHDLRVYAGVSATLVAAGVAAAWFPARRASRVDPLVALRLD